MSDRSLPRRIGAGLVIAAVLAVSAACGGSGADDNPDEASFCRLALVNEPVDEADAPVLRRLDELAPAEIDPAVVVLREAAEELEDLSPRSPAAISLEFEIRFRPDYIDARIAVEAFIEAECVAPTTTTTTSIDPDADPVKDDDKVETELPSDPFGPADDG